MTNKARQRAKKLGKREEADNDLWGAAEKHYTNSVLAVEQAQGLIAKVLEEIVSDDEKFKLIKDPATLQQNVELLNKDVKRHIDLLDKIHQKHQDRKGSAKTQDDYMGVLQINCDYSEAMEVFEATIHPTTLHILELIGTSEEIVQHSAQAAPSVDPELIDPAVVSDITFKEA